MEISRRDEIRVMNSTEIISPDGQVEKEIESFATEFDDIERQVKKGTFSFHQVYIPEKGKISG